MIATNQINAMVVFGVAGGMGGTGDAGDRERRQFRHFPQRRPGEREPGNFHTLRPGNRGRS